ncbi:MAG: hypothetical protein U5M51_10960 [Emticicia sp.]|nr:hypothetical protein [Emticicia sp.]
MGFNEAGDVFELTANNHIAGTWRFRTPKFHECRYFNGDNGSRGTDGHKDIKPII